MRRPPTWLLVTGLLAIPFAVLAVRAVVGFDPSPGGDVALIELRTGDVGTAHNPMLGSYGRYGFNHPGPLWFDVLALPYRLTGQLELGVLLVGVLSVAAILWVAARRDALWWAALLTAVLVAGAGPAFVSDPWEPHGLLLPCAALLLLTFDSVARPWSLPLVAGVASLLAAAQATLLPFAIAMGAIALWSARRHLRPVLAAAAVVLALWAPTLWQQATGDPANISQLVDARHRDEPSLGMGGAWDLVAIELGHTPQWVGFDTPLEGFSGTVVLGAAPLVPIGALVLAYALARRRTPIVVVVAVATVAALVAMSQLLGPVFVWIPQWLRVIGFGCWLAVGWQLASRIPRAALASAVGVVTLLAAWQAATYDEDADHLADAVRELVGEVPALDDPILVSSAVSANLAFGGGADGLETLVLELDRRGVDAVVDRDLAHRYGPRRARPARAEGRELRLVQADGVEPPRGFTSVGVADPLPAELRRERNGLLGELGLPDTASARDVLLAVDDDDERDRIAHRLLEIPDLPRVELLLSPRR